MGFFSSNKIITLFFDNLLLHFRELSPHLYAEVASVDVVTEKEVLCRCRRSSNFKQLHQVVELAVDVPAN